MKTRKVLFLTFCFGLCLALCYLAQASPPEVWWSLRPLPTVTIPIVHNATWSANPVDRFILAKLQEQNLQPASPADKRALLRRVYIDLIGLPPTPEELQAFEADASPDAYEKVVDRLLASPRYGERMARRWMDLVHF